MKLKEFSIKDLKLIDLDVFADNRGFFTESYNRQKFQNELGIDVEFIQDNHSRSVKNVLRGLHFQKPPMAQDKLVSVVKGKVFDVAVDLRHDSQTYGKWEGVTLDENSHQLFFIPKGFAHGFLVLSDIADFQYKVSNYYSKENDGGLFWNDPDIAIEWPVSDPILSEKDAQLPKLKELGRIF
jgi:dTDP-4-dehydrorhamnose 3,5-epimerase